MSRNVGDFMCLMPHPGCGRGAGGRPVLRREYEDGIKAGGFLAGRPEDIVEQLKALEKRYPGLDRVIWATPLGTPLQVPLADLDCFAKEVVPALRDPCTRRRGAVDLGLAVGAAFRRCVNSRITGGRRR